MINKQVHFSQWLSEELRQRKMSQAQLARAANVSRATISKTVNQQSFPSAELCVAIARAFKLPPELVFRHAGLLPPKPEVVKGLEELTHLYGQLSELDQEELLEIARLKAARGKK